MFTRFPYQEATISEWPESVRPYRLLHRSSKGASHTIGYLRPRILSALQAVPVDIRGELEVNTRQRTVYGFQQASEAERSQAVDATLRYWKDRDIFEALRGWRNEKYPVYDAEGKHVIMNIERAGAGLFGTLSAGIHLTAYVKDDTVAGGLKIWVARRSETKPTYPGMLDSTVGGGMPTGESVEDCLVRECLEEASLDEEFVRKSARFAGQLTYFYVTAGKCGDEIGMLRPECSYLYDLELPSDMVPKPFDGEVGGFELLGVDEVKQSLAAGEWKYNSAVTVLKFFEDHGILTKENEENFDELSRRMHRKLDIPGAHWHWKPSE